MNRRITAFLLAVLMIFSLCSCTREVVKTEENVETKVPSNGTLSVHFIDVGQGDCSLLESDGVYVLIDAGEKDYEEAVCKYLRDRGVKTIDYVIATHPHSDHCGSLTKVINTFSCKNFITTQTDQQTQTWINVLLAVDKNNVNYIDAKVGSTYTFGQSQFEILGPHNSYYDDYNNYSVIVKATCAGSSFLFTGDAEKLAEDEMLSHNTDLKADVLKVGHHGSTTSSSNAFLDAVDPDVAVISCGKNNEYGHPHDETIEKLNKRNITIYRTDKLQTIVAKAQNGKISFSYNQTEAVTANEYDEQNSNNLNTASSYVGNSKSKKFHMPSCGSVYDMNDNNKVYFDTRQEAVNRGYIPCKQCNP